MISILGVKKGKQRKQKYREKVIDWGKQSSNHGELAMGKIVDKPFTADMVEWIFLSKMSASLSSTQLRITLDHTALFQKALLTLPFCLVRYGKKRGISRD